MDYYKCDYADEIKNGRCAHKRCKCNGNGYFEFDDILQPVDKKE